MQHSRFSVYMGRTALAHFCQPTLPKPGGTRHRPTPRASPWICASWASARRNLGETDEWPVHRAQREEWRARPPEKSMAWIWMLVAAGAVLLWAVSLGRVLSSPSPSCLPANSTFLSPPHGDRMSRNVLIVLAHPDDESMFFAPSILFLKSKGHNIHILCLSQGNADGLGNIRKEELYLACATFKIPAEQVKVLDHPELQDGFHEKWDHRLIAELTMEQAQLWNIDTIITFDSRGVSGHPNHCNVHYGICKLLRDHVQGHIEAWELVSLNIFRKYSGPVDIWLSSFTLSSSSKQPIYTLVNNSPTRSFEAMAAHKSQWVWFRRLFVLFSSYTYINVLQKI